LKHDAAIVEYIWESKNKNLKCKGKYRKKQGASNLDKFLHAVYYKKMHVLEELDNPNLLYQ